jgi:hypothetical protein
MRIKDLLFSAIVVGGVAGYAWSALGPATAQERPSAPRPAVESPQEPEDEQSAYYPNCDAARAAGKAPIFAGQPGYRSELDADGDGRACEPYRGS